MDRVGLAQNSALGWVLLVAFFAALFTSGAGLLANPSWLSKAAGGLLSAVGVAVLGVLWSGGQFDQNNSASTSPA